jgi:succinate dehydrogenase / fumarate reductase membrane anchor subunit
MAETLRTPLGRVRGLGAGRSGANTWIAERVSSIALALLTPWFLVSLILGLQPGYVGFQAWAARPDNAIMLVLFSAVSFHHMQLGMRVIIEDYIHKPSTKTLLLLANAFFCIGLSVASVFAILTIALRS